MRSSIAFPRGWLATLECGCCHAAEASSVGFLPGGAAEYGVELLRCRGCGTLRSNAYLPPQAAYVDGYHRGATGSSDYSDTTHIAYERVIAARRLRLLERHHPPGRLIDVGGGLGTFAAMAQELGWTPTVLEPVAEAVQQARANGIEAVCGGVGDLAPDGGYAAVSMLHTLEHLPTPAEAIRRVHAALEPGGVFLVEVPNHGSLARRAAGMRWQSWWPGQHVYHFEPRTLRSLLHREGFRVLEMRTIVHAWAQLPLPYYAHITGLEPSLRTLARIARRPRSGSHEPRWYPPLDRDRISRRWLAPILRAAAWAEERVGIGENIFAIATPVGGSA
jgi:SAM-dependent methyltransferase